MGETSVEHDKALEQVVLSTVAASLPKCLRPLSPFCICYHFFPGLSGTSPGDAVSHYSSSLLLSASLFAGVQAKICKQSSVRNKYIYLHSTQQIQHLGQFRFWWRNIHLVNSTEIIVVFAVDFICMLQTSLHILSSLCFSSPSQQLHKNFKGKVGNFLKEHKDPVLARQRESAGTCLSRTCGFSVCIFLANTVYPGSTDGAYHLASLPLSFLQEGW